MWSSRVTWLGWCHRTRSPDCGDIIERGHATWIMSRKKMTWLGWRQRTRLGWRQRTRSRDIGAVLTKRIIKSHQSLHWLIVVKKNIFKVLYFSSCFGNSTSPKIKYFVCAIMFSSLYARHVVSFFYNWQCLLTLVSAVYSIPHDAIELITTDTFTILYHL